MVGKFKHTFEHFKQHYTYFHTLFHPHIYQKYSNNITRTLLPNESWIVRAFFGPTNPLSSGPYWTGPDQSAQISINELQTSPTTQIIWANCHSRLSCTNCLTLSGLLVHTLGILTHRFYLFLNQKGYQSKLNLFIRIF